MKLLLLLAVVAITAYLFWRSRRIEESSSIPRHRVTQTQPDPRQIILRPGPGACPVARQQAGRSFGSDEMPRLPLPGCRAGNCNCRFDVIPGRRSSQRRKSGDRRAELRFESGASDRRRGDRRKGAADPWTIDPESNRD